LEGCVIEDGAIIGMGSIVLNRARVGGRAMLAAGSVVTEDGEIPAEVLAAGAPVEAKKSLDGSSAKWVEGAAREYQALRLRYMGQAAGSATTGRSSGEGGA
jgi:carbonic anhydrase/acetyltransferase-like protein (isoleucine patch superfamily)